MSKDNWYRKTTWTQRDKEDFFSRLKHSRDDFHKAQYLRMQAFSLWETKNLLLIEEAVKLLNQIIEEYPDSSQIAEVFKQKADCLFDLGKINESINCLRQSLEKEIEFPNFKTNSWLLFGWIVVSNQLFDLYDEALNVIENFKSDFLFEIQKYEMFSILALISKAKGQNEEASNFARSALEATQTNHSGLRFHPTIGLVKYTDNKIHQQILKLAEHEK